MYKNMGTMSRKFNKMNRMKKMRLILDKTLMLARSKTKSKDNTSMIKISCKMVKDNCRIQILMPFLCKNKRNMQFRPVLSLSKSNRLPRFYLISINWETENLKNTI